MLQTTQLIGFGSGLEQGPYEAFWSGYNVNNSAITNSANLDIGREYIDRIVFVGVSYYNTDSVSSVTVNGQTANFVGRLAITTTMAWYACIAPPGSGLVNVSATFASSRASVIGVYVLKGGAGLNPIFDVATGYQNNSNSALGYFSSAAPLNDLVFCLGNKALSNAFAGFNSNMTPITNNINYVAYTNAGFGFGFVGPNTTARAAGAAYIQGTGADSSKPTAFCAIKVSKTE